MAALWVILVETATLHLSQDHRKITNQQSQRNSHVVISPGYRVTRNLYKMCDNIVKEENLARYRDVTMRNVIRPGQLKRLIRTINSRRRVFVGESLLKALKYISLVRGTMRAIIIVTWKKNRTL